MARQLFAFLFTSLTLFGLTFVFLAAVDALPEPVLALSLVGEEYMPSEPVATSNSPEVPVRIVAKDIGLDAPIVNPDSTDIEVLDEALLKGAARYPTSAPLGIDGTVMLFGHSSSLPIVNNRVYKTFNGIQNLKEGELISVYSDTREYRYRVTGVRLANADEDMIELRSDGRYLTLVTCNTFAKKSDRFVVTAELEGTYVYVQQ